jgi:hypothetical protein
VRAVAAVLVMAATLIATLTPATALAQPATTPAPTLPSVPSATTTPAPHWHVEPPAPTPSAPVSPDPQSPADPGTGTPDDSSSGGDQGDCGVTDISGCVGEAINGFFRGLVTTALNPLVKLISRTLLATPDLTSLPHVRELWNSSWQLVLALYGLLVAAAGVLLMVHQTVQTRWSLRELAPRIVLGFGAGAFSMALATGAIAFANALARAVAGDGVNADSAAAALSELTANSSGTSGSGTFTILLGVALVVVLVVLMISYVVRVAVTIILVVGAPLALMCHALPGIDAIARWWWRSFGACLAIQVVQSLVLVTCLRVLLTPGGWGIFGPSQNGLVDQIVALALMGILVKTPFWLLSVMKIGQGRTLAGSIVRSYITYKTLGLLKGTAATRTAASKPAPARRPPKPADPYARVRATRDGQLMLPLDGVHRVKRKPRPAARSAPRPAAARAPRGRQLAFDFTPPAPPDPYRGIRPGRGGQYPLPFPVTRVRPAPAPPGPKSPPAKRAPSRAGRGTQLALDFDPPAPPDPYARVRPLRGGQYPLPIPVARVRPAPSAPVPPQPPAPRQPKGRQLHLPLPDLPVRRRAPRTPRGGQR